MQQRNPQRHATSKMRTFAAGSWTIFMTSTGDDGTRRPLQPSYKPGLLLTTLTGRMELVSKSGETRQEAGFEWRCQPVRCVAGSIPT